MEIVRENEPTGVFFIRPSHDLRSIEKENFVFLFGGKTQQQQLVGMCVWGGPGADNVMLCYSGGFTALHSSEAFNLSRHKDSQGANDTSFLLVTTAFVCVCILSLSVYCVQNIDIPTK